VVVLVHGFSSPCDIWDYQFDALTKAGFRVLRYDLFGRGYSDRPEGDYSADRYDRQLMELLDSQGLDEPVHLVGLSMGGAIVTRFTQRHPERVHRMALIAPAGLGADVPAIAQLARVPFLRDWVVKLVGDDLIIGRAVKMFSTNPEKGEKVAAMYREQMSFRGYKRALLSTLLHTPMRSLHDIYAKVGEQDRPKALFWGTADSVVPFKYSEEMRELLPGLMFVEVEDATHALNYAQPEAVNEKLIPFLKGETAAG
jgi:pimeloyl-ACP methyl ester carboxylesterase